MSDFDDESTDGSSDDSDKASEERPGTAKGDTGEAQKPANKADGGSQKATTPVTTVEVEAQPVVTVEDLEAELKKLQVKLDQAKKAKTVADAREKVRDAIANQRATTVLVINAATKAAADWQVEIDKAVTEPDRAELETRIVDADGEVDEAEATFTSSIGAVTAAEAALETAKGELDRQQKAYADQQKELSELAGKIKTSQGEIEKLRTSVKAAIDSGQWTLAFYKNNRLVREIDIATTLTAASTEQNIVDKLSSFEGDDGTVAVSQRASDKAKKAVDDAKGELKTAEQEKKDKIANRDTAIGIFL